MSFDWVSLGERAPTALVKARTLAHHALQWVTKAGRANFQPQPDDSHSSLDWDSERQAFFSQPLPAANGDVRIGLQLNALALLVEHRRLVLDTYELTGRRDSAVAVWLDSALRALGLKAPSPVELPYSIPSHAVARGSAYNMGGDAESFVELARWFSAAADALGAFKEKLLEVHQGLGPVRCWPHHFDVAMLVSLTQEQGENAQSIGIGLSPGDEHYPQPYFYVSPWPRLQARELPALSLGHWHTEGFVGAVLTGEELLPLGDRDRQVQGFMMNAFDLGLERLKV